MLSFFANIFHKFIASSKAAIAFVSNWFCSLAPISYIYSFLTSSKVKKASLFIEKHFVAFHIFLSMAICFIMEWLSRHSFDEAIDFTRLHTKAFLYNSYLIFIFLLLCLLTKKTIQIRILISAIFIAFGYINSIILLNRVTPFGFTDLYMIGDLLTMQNTSYFTRQQAFLLLLVVIVFLVLIGLFIAKGPNFISPIKLSIRIAIVVLAFVTIPFTTRFLQQKNVLASYFGNLAQGYLDYGYLYGFNMSAFSRGMDKPLLYSKDTIQDIVEKTDMGPSAVNGETGPNVVVMLLESFYDVSETKFIETSMDATPFFRSLTENYSSGYLKVPVVGAGTCNSEFEVLTGMSCEFFGPGEYPQKTILKKIDLCESVASVMDSIGYKSHVVHNNGGNFYSRKNAFSLMGFDTFTSKEMLDITDWTPLLSWPTDDILIDATKDAMDSTEERDFVYTITVQTHGDYPEYPVIDYPSIQVTCPGKTEAEKNRWLYYINMLYREDIFLKKYINMLDERGEPTLVIMFGDHLPTMGLTNEEQNNGDIFLTNYATWNNFGMEKEDADLTSYQLVSEYLDRLGIHGGTMVNYNQYMTREDINPRSFRYQNGLHELQYDLLYGNRYAYDEDSPYTATDIEMGVKNIKIDKMYAFGDKLYIYGENFTPWSRVYVDDEPVNTTYRSGQVLTISASHLGEVNPIQVCQMGSNNSIFRKSNKAWYYK